MLSRNVIQLVSQRFAKPNQKPRFLHFPQVVQLAVRFDSICLNEVTWSCFDMR